jgi:hypothetical protein
MFDPALTGSFRADALHQISAHCFSLLMLQICAKARKTIGEA